MSGGRASRDKGNRPSAGGRFTGDITTPLLGVDRLGEAKVRARGFQQLYDWLDGNDFLVVKTDRLEPLVVVRWGFALEVAKVAERKSRDRANDSEGDHGRI